MLRAEITRIHVRSAGSAAQSRPFAVTTNHFGAFSSQGFQAFALSILAFSILFVDPALAQRTTAEPDASNAEARKALSNVSSSPIAASPARSMPPIEAVEVSGEPGGSNFRYAN